MHVHQIAVQNFHPRCFCLRYQAMRHTNHHCEKVVPCSHIFQTMNKTTCCYFLFCSLVFLWICFGNVAKLFWISTSGGSLTAKTCGCQTIPFSIDYDQTLHKKWSFPLRIFLVNVTKLAVSCRFGHIYWRYSHWETSFFVQCKSYFNPLAN